MKMLGANCREQFSADDFEFIAAALSRRAGDHSNMTELLTDAAARDAALESEPLLAALVDSPAPAPVTPHLYFYVVTRNGLKAFDRGVADYIANVLAAFLDRDRLRAMPTQPDWQSDYLADMLAFLRQLSGEAAFVAQAHVGNYSLFMSGIFPEHIRYREKRRGAPGLAYYEEVGRKNYCRAADYQQARQQGLDEVLRTIGEGFPEVRRGLNEVADRFLHLESEGGFAG